MEPLQVSPTVTLETTSYVPFPLSVAAATTGELTTGRQYGLGSGGGVAALLNPSPGTTTIHETEVANTTGRPNRINIFIPTLIPFFFAIDSFIRSILLFSSFVPSNPDSLQRSSPAKWCRTTFG
jgi:hypothetical protein